MAISFPSSLDSLTNPGGSDYLNSPDHAQQHSDANDALEALEAKVGVDSSAVTTSLDYLLKSTSSSNPGHKHTLATGATNVTATAAEVNVLSGITSTTAELNVLHGMTADTSELNVLDGMTASTAELNFIDNSIAGTSVASKALVLGASKNTDLLVIDNAIKFNAPAGFLLNGQIVVSVSSNNLTVAVKTLSGSDASSSNPVHVRIGTTVRSITAALSVTLNAGTNYSDSGRTGLATNPVDYFVYIGFKVSDSSVILGFSRLPYGTLYSDFSGTNTNDRYLAVSATPASTDVFELVDRFTATLSATAAFTWSITSSGSVYGRPITYTNWSSFSPVFTGFSANPTVAYRYQIADKKCFIYQYTSGTGTSNGTGLTETLPITSGNVGRLLYCPAKGINNGAALTTPALAQINQNSATMDLYTNFASAAWTNVNAKAVDFEIFYDLII